MLITKQKIPPAFVIVKQVCFNTKKSGYYTNFSPNTVDCNKSFLEKLQRNQNDTFPFNFHYSAVKTK